jgi:hypothetical protein
MRKNEYNEAVDQVFIDFNKAHDSVRVRREVLFNILNEFGNHTRSSVLVTDLRANYSAGRYMVCGRYYW